MNAQEYIDLVKTTLDALDPTRLDQLVDAFHTTYEPAAQSVVCRLRLATATCRNGPRRASRPVEAGCCDYLVTARYTRVGERTEREVACGTEHAKRFGLTGVEDTPFQIGLARRERQFDAVDAGV